MIPGFAIASLVAAVLSFAAGWTTHGWRLESAASKQRADMAEAVRKAEEVARLREQQLVSQNERIARDYARKQARLADRSATTELVARGLRDDIARLNSRSAPVDPAAARAALEARVARELLGECAEKYRGVAEEADRLGIQVNGLLAFVHSITRKDK